MLELMLGDDPRVDVPSTACRAPSSRRSIDAHDLVVLPSLWECWPTVGLEALERNRPLLATPTGGFTEIVEPGPLGLAHRRRRGRAAGARRSRSSPPRPSACRELRRERRAARGASPSSPIPSEIRAAYAELAAAAPPPATPRPAGGARRWSRS